VGSCRPAAPPLRDHRGARQPPGLAGLTAQPAPRRPWNGEPERDEGQRGEHAGTRDQQRCTALARTPTAAPGVYSGKITGDRGGAGSDDLSSRREGGGRGVASRRLARRLENGPASLQGVDGISLDREPVEPGEVMRDVRLRKQDNASLCG